MAVKADVSSRIDVNRMVEEALRAFKKIDILVNNAGIIKPAPLEDLTEEDWDRVIDVNLKGQFLCSQAVGRKMIERREGTIVNIASLSGETPELWSGAYSPSKAGVISLTQQMAIEWAKYNIRVNAISPGAVLTPLTKSFYPTKEEYEKRQKTIPLGRFAKPEDIAKAAVFLASDESAYITGEIINVDGGQQASIYYLIGKRGTQKE
jgi:NAD(P)-dependent dehydrogenase (short-subunit alcohol dehydrogenase family)